ncbi:MAG TPA: hypothetical protein VF644_11100 [Pyrinomonadaceae bacterium]|jgi:hypothetical protein
MSNEIKILEIYLTTDEFEQVRSEPRFLMLIRLARIVNQLNFCFDVLLSSTNYKTPAGERQYLNSFLFSCGVLYEGLKFIRPLGKDFSSYKSYKNGFAKLWKDKDTHYLRENVLNKMRNGIVFHIDSQPIEETIQVLKLDAYQFLASAGYESGEVYYNLADAISLNYIVGKPASNEEEERIFRDILGKIGKVGANYVKSANELIAEFIKEKSWQFREVPRKIIKEPNEIHSNN